MPEPAPGGRIALRRRADFCHRRDRAACDQSL